MCDSYHFKTQIYFPLKHLTRIKAYKCDYQIHLSLPPNTYPVNYQVLSNKLKAFNQSNTFQAGFLFFIK